MLVNIGSVFFHSSTSDDEDDYDERGSEND